MDTPGKIKAILFDMDGVIAHSEPVHGKAWDLALREAGLELSPNWYRNWFGLADQTVVEWIMSEYTPDQSREVLLERKFSLALQLLREELECFPGLGEALGDLKRYRLGLCTSSRAEEVSVLLERTGLTRLFEVIVSSGDVSRRKPAPDAYLLAARKLGLDPSECLVVEDTHIGIEAAKAAGMQVVAVRTTQPDAMLNLADRLFNTTVDAVTWLKNIG